MQITALRTSSLSGKIIPPQLLYQDKTQQCTPTSVRFPKESHVHYSENHWSNEVTMCIIVDTVLLPYIIKMRDSLLLTFKTACLVCVWCFYCTPNGLKKNGIIAKSIPSVYMYSRAAAIGSFRKLQIQRLIKKIFGTWYYTEIKKNVNCKYFGYN